MADGAQSVAPSAGLSTDCAPCNQYPAPKSEKELLKEKIKADKAKKFAEKQQKLLAAREAGKKKSTAQKKVSSSDKDPLPEYIEETKKGEKKIIKPLDDDFHKAYIPRVVESAWYDWWEKEGFFKPEFDAEKKVKEKGAFVVAVPPPNVTGALHCGHALGNALQDCLVRWSRMKGLTTLFVPGCDHAGIATQAVVEKMLWRREQKTRHDLGRELFIQRAWEWKDEYHERIVRVLRRMGGSYEWGMEAFTMDPRMSAAVIETFVRLHEEGLIYRSNRIVNWDTRLNTALSSLEVDSRELPGRTLLSIPGYEKKVEFGVLTHFKYLIEGVEGGIIEVATTRPETMLGDTGIAVHPDDSRYSHLVGMKAKHPFCDRVIPIVADLYVDPEFGTGAVKITPAHDPNDFEIGKRHKLEFVNILNDDGTLNENSGRFQGMRRFDARYTVVEELTKMGLFVTKSENAMKVPISSRSGDVVEPMMKPQWWMRMRELADEGIKAVRGGQIKIRPGNAEKSYFRWLENVNDWCLSRQLWWGHQIPAYLVEIEGEEAMDSDDRNWVSGRTIQEAEEKAAKKSPGKKYSLRRDPDVLDTWFSSALWPFAILGWPQKTEYLQKLFPTSMIETGWDILFFWVARMIMFSIKLTGQVPFREVYCHSLIRDSEGRKMSKSLGNVIDPVSIIQGISLEELNSQLVKGNLDPKEYATASRYQQTTFPNGIPECGADALRFSLIHFTTGGGDIAFDVKVMHGFRRFCNKIYQATKYVLGRLGPDFRPPEEKKVSGTAGLAERWILHKFSMAVRDINRALSEREFSRATQIVYQYWYENLCDVFIENSKVILQDGGPEERRGVTETLYTCLEGGLRMIHPFMPFLSEELWQRLPQRLGDAGVRTIMRASYPEPVGEYENAPSAQRYEIVLACSRGIRSLMSEYEIKEGAKVYIQADEVTHHTVTQELGSIRGLCKARAIERITVLGPGVEPDGAGTLEGVPWGSAVAVVSSQLTVYLDVSARLLAGDPGQERRDQNQNQAQVQEPQQNNNQVEREVEKVQKKLVKAREAAEKVRALVRSPDFASRVSAAVEQQELARLAELDAQVRSYQRSLLMFENLRV